MVFEPRMLFNAAVFHFSILVCVEFQSVMDVKGIFLCLLSYVKTRLFRPVKTDARFAPKS
jgi:hypothetical protein